MQSWNVFVVFTPRSPPGWSIPHSITNEAPLGAVYVVEFEAGHDTDDELDVGEEEVEDPVEDPPDVVELVVVDDEGDDVVPLRM